MTPKQHVVIIVQARMGSTRLPGKVLKEVLGKPLLMYLIERLRRVEKADAVVIATTDLQEDDVIAALCAREQIQVVRGSSSDVLGRYASAAAASQADPIVRICADCALIDPAVIDEAITFYLAHLPQYAWVGNFLERRYPRGYEVEVFSRQALDTAVEQAKELDEREHVTPYLYRHPELFGLAGVRGDQDLGHHRWVVDTADDFALISRILSSLYPNHPHFNTADIVSLLEKHPNWIRLNAHVEQRHVTGFPGETRVNSK